MKRLLVALLLALVAAPADAGVSRLCGKAALCGKGPTVVEGEPDFSFQGFGSSTTGGQGQATAHVTNCNNSGAGSLREAISGSNRTIVFDQSCTINATSHLIIDTRANVTVDGCTAPSPGITIDGAGGLLVENSNNVIVQCLRSRNSSDDAFAAFNSTNVVFHRVSGSGYTDGCIDITEGSTDVTVQWSICTYQAAGDTLGNLVSYDAYRVTFHHNILASSERNPLCKIDDSSTSGPAETMCDVVNNIIWEWGANFGANFGYGAGSDWAARMNVVNNFLQENGAVSSELGINLDVAGSNSQIYASGNISGNGTNLDDNGNAGSPFAADSVTTHSVAQAVDLVLQYAGCQPLDATDQAVVDDITNNGNLP